MSVSLGANGSSYDYPETGELSWGSNATNYASAVSAAITKLGLGSTLTASAVIDIVSTTKGIRIPSMTTTQRDAISSPVSGLLIFNTTLNTLDVYYLSAWYQLNINNSPSWASPLTTKAPSESAVKSFMPQSIFSSNNYQTVSTSTSYADILSALATVWEVSITPKLTSSKINIIANIGYSLSRNNTEIGFGIRILRKIGAGSYVSIYDPTAGGTAYDIYFYGDALTSITENGRYLITIQDSPGSVSTITYKLQFALYASTSSGSATINLSNTDPQRSTIILSEAYN